MPRRSFSRFRNASSSIGFFRTLARGRLPGSFIFKATRIIAPPLVRRAFTFRPAPISRSRKFIPPTNKLPLTPKEFVHNKQLEQQTKVFREQERRKIMYGQEPGVIVSLLHSILSWFRGNRR